jgi:hypothetical protein
MKNRNPVAELGLLFAVLLILGAARAQADILPPVTIGFAPFGLTLTQTARLDLVNISMPNGMLVNWRFIDASGGTLAQSSVILPLNKIVSVDYRPQGSARRAEVRAQVDILTANVPSQSLRRSLQLFNNDTGATTVFIGDGQ